MLVVFITIAMFLIAVSFWLGFVVGKDYEKCNDWMIVWTKTTCTEHHSTVNNIHAEYHIYYSPSRERYKLVTKGFRPERNCLYAEAVEVFNKYCNGELEAILQEPQK